MTMRQKQRAAVALLGIALVAGGLVTVRAAANPHEAAPPSVLAATPPPVDTLDDATPEQKRCFARNDGTERAKVSAWRRPEPRYKAYRAVLDAAYRRASGNPYHYNAPIAGVPFGLLGHGLDEKTGRVILHVDPKLIDPVPYARHLEAVARKANVRKKVPAGQEITVAVQPGCFSAKQIEALRDRMRWQESYRGEHGVERVGRDVEFDGRLHVLVHLDERELGEQLRRREGPMLAIYWTSKGTSKRQGYLDYQRSRPTTPAAEVDDLADATPAQRACITRNDRLRKENEERVGWWGDLDRRQYVAETLTRAAYKAATGKWVYQGGDSDRLRHGFFGYDFDEPHNRLVFQVDPRTLDLPAFRRTMEAEARKANRKLNVPPGHDVRILVQPSCFTTKEMLAVRDRMQDRRHPDQVQQVTDFIRWDGRLHIEVDTENREYGEELRRKEGPILAVDWVPDSGLDY